MTELEKCMESMIVLFHRYASKDGHAKSLTKKEMKSLLENELPSFMQSQTDPHLVDRVFKDLDEDHCDRLNFQQFCSFVIGLEVACEKCYLRTEQAKQKK